MAGPNNFRKEFGKRISKKKRKGELFTGGPAPTNRPSQRSQPRPTAPRPPPPRTRSDTAAPRAPDRVRPTAPRGRHALLAGATTPPLRCGQRHLPRHSLLHPVRAPSLSLALSCLLSTRTVPPLAIGAPRAPLAVFPALRRLSELRIRLRVLGRSFFAQVSGSSEPNRSPELSAASASLVFPLPNLSCLASARIMVVVAP